MVRAARGAHLAAEVEVQHVVALRDVKRSRHVASLLARLAGHADARDLRQRLVIVEADRVYPRQLAPWPGCRAVVDAERLRLRHVDRLEVVGREGRGSLGAGELAQQLQRVELLLEARVREAAARVCAGTAGAQRRRHAHAAG
eukprot:scaffold74421_cov59-Phaeocystis_antarctica.AAC.6